MTHAPCHMDNVNLSLHCLFFGNDDCPVGCPALIVWKSHYDWENASKDKTTGPGTLIGLEEQYKKDLEIFNKWFMSENPNEFYSESGRLRDPPARLTYCKEKLTQITKEFNKTNEDYQQFMNDASETPYRTDAQPIVRMQQMRYLYERANHNLEALKQA